MREERENESASAGRPDNQGRGCERNKRFYRRLDLENPCLMLFGLALDALGNAERGKNAFVGRKASIVWLPHRVVLPTY